MTTVSHVGVARASTFDVICPNSIGVLWLIQGGDLFTTSHQSPHKPPFPLREHLCLTRRHQPYPGNLTALQLRRCKGLCMPLSAESVGLSVCFCGPACLPSGTCSIHDMPNFTVSSAHSLELNARPVVIWPCKRNLIRNGCWWWWPRCSLASPL